jgi:CelD/BcsL family acetyltransferase involved in cellulose biosynthesis
VLDRLLRHAMAVVTELAGDRAWGRPPRGLVPLEGAGQGVDLDSLRFLGAKMASYGLVTQEPDAAAAVYTES